MQEESLAVLKEGLREACQSGGTGYPFFDSPYEVMCKPERLSLSGGRAGSSAHARLVHGGAHSSTADETVLVEELQPEVIITVLVESDEENRFKEGSADAAPVARAVADWWWAQR